MAIAEREIEAPTVRLADLLAGTRPELSGVTGLTLVDYAAEITRSGFPAIRELSGRLRRTQLDGYLDRIVERDFYRRPDGLGVIPPPCSRHDGAPHLPETALAPRIAGSRRVAQDSA